MAVPEKNDARYADYVLQISQQGILRSGVINEPRIFFDEIAMPANAAQIAQGTPGVFVNGEQFPVRLTHMLAAVRFFNNAAQPAQDSEFNIQRMLLRMRFHDQMYMNPLMLPLPLWGNKKVAAPDPFSSGNAHWDFVESCQPFVLSTRDTLQVSVQLQGADPDVAVPVDVAFHGIGGATKRPYLLSGSALIDDLNPTVLSTVDFRNDGVEPIVVTDMTAAVGALVDDVDPTGLIGRLRINVKQSGNGTNADWFVGPKTPVTLPNMQATLLGVTTGRAIVHRFPGDGLIWEPGEGITVEAQPRVDNTNTVLCLALAGNIMVV